MRRDARGGKERSQGMLALYLHWGWSCHGSLSVVFLLVPPLHHTKVIDDTDNLSYSDSEHHVLRSHTASSHLHHATASSYPHHATASSHLHHAISSHPHHAASSHLPWATSSNLHF